MEENLNNTLKETEFLAHVQFEPQKRQKIEEHLNNTAEFSQKICPVEELRTIAWLTMLFHDAGKLSDEIQEDYRRILKYGEDVHKHNMDHSTAGGRIVTELTTDRVLARFISTAIYSHHGLQDCINLETGKTLKEERDEKNIEYDVITNRFWCIYKKEQIKEKFFKAENDLKIIKEKIQSFLNECKEKKIHCGTIWFYLGMYQRLLLSIVIDCDWTDTASFAGETETTKRWQQEAVDRVWTTSLDYFENYLCEKVRENPGNGKELKDIRQEISDLCKDAAYQPGNLYRLTVPTGAGKTLSSLRFALHRAKKEKKSHIIYIAPFNSILEQNAQEIRMAVGRSEIVLEHHCNVICDTEEEEQKYQKMTEIWDEPIIVTTAVQILNTLFSAQKSCIRRMHSICNSIIIFDEVQALPVRCTELFNLAVNFLGVFCNTTVVLCSATQPSLSTIAENNVYNCREMAGNWNKYISAFKRSQIIDFTDQYPGGMHLPDVRNLVHENLYKYNSVLVIVNTTRCARELYQMLKLNQEGYELFHLSNNMCAQNKIEKLSAVRTALNLGKRVICVSTPLVEAGVNFSFGCVIRSMAGLDNVIQAAGRCNRHKELKFAGVVYIVRIAPEDENLQHLPEISLAQNALQNILDMYRENEKKYDYSLDSQAAVKDYYKKFFQLLEANITKFPTKQFQGNLVELLGKDNIGRKQYERRQLEKFHRDMKFKSPVAQAFRTAGEQFEVISEAHKINIIIPYNDEARWAIEALENEYLSEGQIKRELKKLQRYTVGISEKKREELNNALYSIGQNEILVLNEGYYDENIGVLENPEMDFYEF